MRNVIQNIRLKIVQIPFAAQGLGLLGLAVYLYSAFQTAHTKLSFLDEGLYLFKGWLFATGRYQMFEDYGLWSNHLPLSFFIPGWAQVLFGPGLRTGRYFAIFMAVVMLIGLWMVVRGVSSKWWATGAVWVFALNPASIKLYTIAISQGIVAMIFVWMLFFTILPNRKWWHLALAGMLSGIIILTRENLIIVYGVLVLFAWWRYGWKPGIAAFIGGLIPLVIVHGIFWPGILTIWAKWFPAGLTPFLNPYRLISNGTQITDYAVDKAGFLEERSLNFWLLLRTHFVTIFAAVSSLLLFPARKAWADSGKFKAAFFLTVLFWGLFLMHLYATFGMDYCVSCILLYIGFFDFLALVLFALVCTSITIQLPNWRKWLVRLTIPVLLVGMLINSVDDVLKSVFIKSSQSAPGDGSFLSPLVSFIQTSMNLRYYPAVRVLSIAGLVLGLLILSIIALIVIRKKKIKFSTQFEYRLIGVLMVLGLILSPTLLLGSANNFFDCGGDVIKQYEEDGAQLRNLIEPGKKVFWEGRSDAIFLYLPDAVIYPPQLNHVHGYYREGDTDSILRFGRYNNHLASQWFGEADYILLEEQYAKKWELETIASGGFTELGDLKPLGQCSAAGTLRLFKRE